MAPRTTPITTSAPSSALRSALSRRSFLAGAGAVGAGMALAGCAPMSSSQRPETITLYVTKQEVLPYFDDVIARFHDSQSKIRVVRDSTSSLPADFVRAAPPDLGCLNYNYGMVSFVEHGALTDLSDMREADEINPDLWSLVKQTADYPGRRSVLPFSMMSASVIYNKRIFDEQGLTVPTTWTELTAICEKLLAADITPFYNTYKDTWTIAQGMFDYSVGGMVDVKELFTKLDAEGTNVGPNSSVSFEKAFAEPMQRVQQLAKWSNKNAASRGYADGNLAFAKGESAMYLQGPWSLTEIAKTDPKMDLGTFPMPATDDPADRKIRVNVDLALWIPEQSKKQEAAREFLSYLMSPKIADKYNAANNGFGTKKNSPPAQNPALAGMQSYYDEAKFYLGPSQIIPAEIPVANYVQSIALGAQPQPQLRTLDADWARVARRTTA